ncbi:hypothetical protein [Ferrovum myxofaciens]|uniref:hypothetical protein n=1 Tax=Ferrovum myxofaciens TaxID=416213 RepID=UPI000A7F90D2|nr:hypothetical protein [Ferrovum myxofaciens]
MAPVEIGRFIVRTSITDNKALDRPFLGDQGLHQSITDTTQARNNGQHHLKSVADI